MARPRRTDQLQELQVCDDVVVHLDRVRSAQRSVPDVTSVDGMSLLFGALGDPTRLRIIATLAGDEMCVCDIAAALGLSTSAVSHQLRVLRDRGLVRHRRSGRLVYYALDDEHVRTLYQQALDHVAHGAVTP